jgi:putative ABC transport system permease protein
MAPSLAWRQLIREPLRLLIAVAGVAFAVILIFMQLGFEKALFDSSVTFHQRLAGDLFLISPQSDFLVSMKPFSRRRLYQAAGHAGVADVRSIYIGLHLWKNPENYSTRKIFIVGFDPRDSVLDITTLREQLPALQLADQVLYDALSRIEFGPIADRFRAGQPIATEVGTRKVSVAGLFELGTTFGIDGTLVTSDLNFRRLFPNRPPGLIDLGLIRLAAGSDAEAMRATLTAALPPDVLVLTKQGYIEKELNYWRTSTPIGFVFSFGVVMGLFVGTIIVYQILFTDVADHLAEYATLKAMGYRNAFLFTVVISEAVILAVLGFLPGLLLSWRLYLLAEAATHMPLTLSVPLGAKVLALTVTMCCISGALALRKIRSADPAEIF